MAMDERKCQTSWSSKKSSRMQSRLCSRDSAGIFCRDKQEQIWSWGWTPCGGCEGAAKRGRGHYLPPPGSLAGELASPRIAAGSLGGSGGGGVWLTCQVLRPWKKKKRAKPHTTDVQTMHSNGMGFRRSPLRSCREREPSEASKEGHAGLAGGPLFRDGGWQKGLTHTHPLQGGTGPLTTFMMM